jgi:hypothetical protein
MKLIGAAFCVAAVCSVGLAAQTSETTKKTKVTVKDGKEMDVIGCVETNPGGGYLLTNVGGSSGMRYVLVTEDDMSKHVGHRVEIHGKATDKGDAKVKIDTKTTTGVHHGDDKETKTKTERKGDLAGTPYLGVKSLKMISASCP